MSVSGGCGIAEGVAGVFAGLPLLVAGIDVSASGEGELVALLAETRCVQRCLDGLVMRIGERCTELASQGLAASAQDVMRGDGAVGARQARRDTARARTASKIFGLGDAVSSGAVSGEHVDAIARHTAKLNDEQNADVDFGELVAKAAGLPVETFDRLVKRRVEAATADHGLADAKAKRAASEFRHWYDSGSGMGRFSGALDPERYETVINAIEHQMAAMASQAPEPVTMNRNLAARALVELVTSAGGVGDSRAKVPSVIVIVDHDTMVHGPHDGSVRQTEQGHDLAPETVARLCCDAVIRRVTFDGAGVPVNVGRKYRTATDAQWAAIKAMHTTCAWGGCDAPINWCQAHHIREWDNGGPTDLANLIPLCSQHHHHVHEGRWRIQLLADRTLRIIKPDGAHHTTVPTPQRE